MRLHELFEQDKSDTLMPQNAHEFEQAWAALKQDADDLDDIDFYSNDVIKNDVHAIIRKDGYRMSLGKAESLYRRQLAKKGQPAAPAAPATAPASKPAPSKSSKEKPAKVKPKAKKPQSADSDDGTGAKLKGKLGDLQDYLAKRIKTGTKFADKYTKGV